ncbi:hypothetical protein Pla175_04610 [Pirellulimonas nuda]|uniref:Uncharacterized protein n=1 Tax=Pirellulimonas nuda TaxID=2528009 RepID=A0A518D6M6_9BACT|nr:hypothetical protein [Pirellulimonas nuda]QDU87106.1 hypothetical protein Pla175_04610 [Pirellulimonas nuda]
MDFRERLKRAADRGVRTRQARDEAAAADALSDEECRRRHSAMRLALSETIETLLGQLADNFPGFRVKTIVDERGWGAQAVRDDVGVAGGKRTNFFSRLQVTVSPYNDYHVLDVAAKGAVRNKESFTRGHFEKLRDAELEHFAELIEQWVLDYAEQYAAA